MIITTKSVLNTNQASPIRYCTTKEYNGTVRENLLKIYDIITNVKNKSCLISGLSIAKTSWTYIKNKPTKTRNNDLSPHHLKSDLVFTKKE